MKNLIGEVTTDGKPQAVWNGDLSVTKRGLTSLEGAPLRVIGNFYFSDNHLTSLEGAPVEVTDNFIGSNIPELSSLKGAPRKVGGNVSLLSCRSLVSLSGFHLLFDEISGTFYCDDPTHVLGLCLIKGLKRVRHDNSDVQFILNQHLNQGKAGMVDAYDELMDTGYLEEYAKL